MKFEGTVTAMVTPFGADGAVDGGALRALVDRQAEGGVEGLVAVGTSGESPTLDRAEHIKVIEMTAEAAAGRMFIVAGTGANSTAEAVDLTKAVVSSGCADATLQVAPYYNKPNAEGMYRHFAAVADLGLPVILYNVPGRTGREIPLDVVKRLAAHPNVVAIKEAAGSVDRVSAIRDMCDLAVFSGDDSLALPMISAGACGVISVASNVIPREMSDFVRMALAGDVRARAEHARLWRLFHDLFLDTNPVPVKEALAMMGLLKPVFRLPLCEMAADARARLAETLKRYGLVAG